MEKIETYIGEMSGMEIFLLTCIFLFVSAFIVFMLLILSSRVNKIKKEILKKKNSAFIEKTLFTIAFDGETFENLKNDSGFSGNWKQKYFKSLLLEELINLHRLFEGENARNLNRFYTSSGLMQLSFEKIRNRNWEIKCAGIQELSEMEIKKAIPVIQEHTSSSNETLRMVALIEVIHLMGLKGLALLENYNQYLNDWIQLNLLESIKEAREENVPDFGYLLQSKNESIVIFGLRLLRLFHQSQHLQTVKLLRKSSSTRIKVQAISTYKDLLRTTRETDAHYDNIPLQMPSETYHSEEKNSYNKIVLRFVVVGILILMSAVLAYWFYLQEI